jgi:hypothetical protein
MQVAAWRLPKSSQSFFINAPDSHFHGIEGIVDDKKSEGREQWIVLRKTVVEVFFERAVPIFLQISKIGQ